MDKKVSIILPVYKVSSYLEECIRSLMEQDYENLEIIPVDDGSPDDCGAVLDRLAAEDDRIKPIHKQNGGAASARNAGLDAATGEYICFVDSDDKVERQYVTSLVRALEDSGSDIAVCGFFFWSTRQADPCQSITAAGTYDGRSYLVQFLRDWSCSLLWNKIYRRQVIGELRMVEGHRVDDEYFTYQLAMNARTVTVIDRKLYHYRLRKTSVMQDVASGSEPIMLDRIGYMIARDAHIQQRFPELSDAFFINAVDNLIRYRRHSKDMPNAQSIIRQWSNTNLWRLAKCSLPIRQKLACILAFYFDKPRFCGEQNSIELEQRDYFS